MQAPQKESLETQIARASHPASSDHPAGHKTESLQEVHGLVAPRGQPKCDTFRSSALLTLSSDTSAATLGASSFRTSCGNISLRARHSVAVRTRSSEREVTLANDATNRCRWRESRVHSYSRARAQPVDGGIRIPEDRVLRISTVRVPCVRPFLCNLWSP